MTTPVRGGQLRWWPKGEIPYLVINPSDSKDGRWDVFVAGTSGAEIVCWSSGVIADDELIEDVP